MAIGKDGALVMKYKYQLTSTEKTYDSAAAAYTAFCADLSIDSSVSLGSFNGDDSAWVFEGIPIRPMSDKPFVGKIAISSEGGIGFYDSIPASTSPVSISISNVSRMFVPKEVPIALITFHPPSIDGKSFNTKYNKNENGICFYMEHSQYNNAVGAIAVAIKVTPKEIFFYFEKKTTSNLLMPVYLNTFAGNNSTATAVINQYNLGTMFFYSTMCSLSVNLNVQYAPTGDAVVKNININDAQNVKTSKLYWNQDVPAATTLKVSYGISDTFNTEPTTYLPIQSGESPLTVGQSYTGKYLCVKIHMETADIAVSPSLQNMVLEYTNTTDENKIAIVLEPNGRLKSPERAVEVIYNEALGRLRGVGGAIETFTQSFIPDGLWKVRDPGNVEHVDITNASAATSFMKINYQNRAYEENVGIAGIAITPTLTHINELGG